MESLLGELKWVLRIGGLWPLEDSYVRFSAWITYFSVYLCLEMADLMHVAGNQQLMIANLMESAYTLMSLVGMLVIRFSRTIRDLLSALQNQTEIFEYENIEEQMIFIKYYSMVRFFNKTAITFSTTSVILYYLKPAISFFVFNLFASNQTIALTTPTRIRFFFDVYSNLQTTAVFYILEAPVMYIEVYRVAKISLLMTLVFTVCIQISILSRRVKNLKFTHTSESYQKIFCNFIEQHLQSINMTKSINNSFHALLFFELTISTLLLSLIGYNTMMNFDIGQILIIISAVTYAIAMLLVILAHCIIGEFLIIENADFYTSCFECIWYEMPVTYQKTLLICMRQAAHPLRITAGNIYIFSLSKYTEIIKSAFGYLSVLRSMT